MSHSSILTPPPSPSDEGSSPQQITWITVFPLIAGLAYLLTRTVAASYSSHNL